MNGVLDFGSLILTWIITLVQLGVLIGLVTLLILSRRKHPHVKGHWSEAVMPIVVFILIHSALYRIWPNFWSNWFETPGFLFLQVVVAAGFYTRSLNTKQAKVLGTIASVIGCIGLSLGLYEAYKLTNNVNPIATITAVVTPKTPPTPTPIPVSVVAPIGTFGNRVYTPGFAKLSFERAVWVQMSDGRPPVYWTGGELGKADWLEFKSPDNAVVKGTVTTF